jgi:hypothetical protein
MFTAPEGGQQNNDNKKQELNNIVPPELSVEVLHCLLRILRGFLLMHGLEQRCAPSSEHGAEHRAIDDEDYKEDELCHEPSFVVPMQVSTKVSVVNITNSGHQ